MDLVTVSVKRRGRPEAGQTENPVVEIQGFTKELREAFYKNEEISEVLSLPLISNSVPKLSAIVADYYNDAVLASMAGASTGPTELDMLLSSEAYQDFYAATFAKIAEDAEKLANAKAALARKISTVVNAIGLTFPEAFEKTVSNWRSKQVK